MNEAILAISALSIFSMASALFFQFRSVRLVMETLCATSICVFAAMPVFASMLKIESDFWTYFTFYCLGFLVFIQIFAVFYKSVSLRLLSDIYSHGENEKTKDRIYSRYIIQGSFEQRLTNLEKSEFISRRNNKIFLTPKGRKMVKRLNLLQRIFGIAYSG